MRRRLVFSDWLQENGQPERAEFIRLQCEIAALDRYAPGRRPLLLREKELLRKFGKRWLKQDGLTRWIDSSMLDAHIPSARYRRGFVECARFKSPDAYLKVAEPISRCTPLREIHLRSPFTFTSDEQSDQVRHAAWAIFEEAHGWGNSRNVEPRLPEPTEFQRLVNSPWFGQLRGFSVEDYFDQQHLEVLLSAPASKGLRDLDLSTWTSVLIGKAWTPLAEAKSLAKLESLTLDGCELQAEGLRSLAQAPLRNLRRLSIIAGEGWEMGPEGFRILTSRKNLPKLQTLFLRNQSGGGEGLKILTAWPGLKRLARLNSLATSPTTTTPRIREGFARLCPFASLGQAA